MRWFVCPRKRKLQLSHPLFWLPELFFYFWMCISSACFSSLLGLFIYFCVQSFFLRKNMLDCVLPADLKFWVPEKSSTEPAPQNVPNVEHWFLHIRINKIFLILCLSIYTDSFWPTFILHSKCSQSSMIHPRPWTFSFISSLGCISEIHLSQACQKENTILSDGVFLFAGDVDSNPIKCNMPVACCFDQCKHWSIL